MDIIVAISEVNDGNMAFRQGNITKDIIANRLTFLSKNDIIIEQSTRLGVTYGGDDYCRYIEINEDQKVKGMQDFDAPIADAIVTRNPNYALFLPLGDCIGAVIFDPSKQIFMMTHLGRHSIEQNGGYKSVRFLVDNYKCDPSDLLVWLSPSPGQESYPVYAFNNRSLKDIAFEQLFSAGIIKENITDNPADTAKDSRYFSYSEFLKGNTTINGRYAMVAMMKK